MSYYLGIDAGGTKTTCVLGDTTSVLSHATAGSIKVMRVSDEEADANLALLLQDASSQAGVPLDKIDCTCIGLAGITVARVEHWTRSALQARLSGKILLCGDEEIALDGAFSGEPGVLVMAGTGSNVIGRTIAGDVFHIGGWGPVLSDEGSGYRIGLQAVRAVLHAWDSNTDTQLLAAILKAWQITTIQELVDLGNRMPGPDFSLLAPIVTQCAEQGDAIARSVLQAAGSELGKFVADALQRVQGASPSAEATLKLAFTGSVLSKIQPVRDALIATVQSVLMNVEIHEEPVDAAMGALWRARHDKVLSLYVSNPKS